MSDEKHEIFSTRPKVSSMLPFTALRLERDFRVRHTMVFTREQAIHTQKLKPTTKKRRVRFFANGYFFVFAHISLTIFFSVTLLLSSCFANHIALLFFPWAFLLIEVTHHKKTLTIINNNTFEHLNDKRNYPRPPSPCERRNKYIMSSKAFADHQSTSFSSKGTSSQHQLKRPFDKASSR